MTKRLINGVIGFLVAFVVVSVGFYCVSCLFGDDPASIITIIPDTIDALHNTDLSKGDYLVNWFMIYPTLIIGPIAGLVGDDFAIIMKVVLASFGICVVSVVGVVFVAAIIPALFESFIATAFVLALFATPTVIIIEIIT